MIGLLAECLRASGLCVDPAVASVECCRILHHGEQHFEGLRIKLGRQIDPFRASAVQSLGVGAALTRFATEMTPLSNEHRDAVTALGGLACLIVSAFDAIVDSGGTPPAIFSNSTREEALPGRVVNSLVAEYYRLLHGLPHTNPLIRGHLDRAIEKMYAAELRSTVRGEDSRSVWWRKNVLPFVVMSLPAWISIDSGSGVAYGRHMRWVARLGEFLGWIDDAVDLDVDKVRGHANRLTIVLPYSSESGLAARIAHQGGRLLREWDEAGGTAGSREILATVVWSWMERALR